MYNKIARLHCVICICFCILALLIAKPAQCKTVYEEQPPITDAELLSFIDLLPHFRAWSASNSEEATPSITDGKADFLYSQNAAKWVMARGFEARRFFAIMGRAAAALFIVAEGSELKGDKPTDMPEVSKVELELVRRHLAALLQAGSDAPPIN